MDKEEKLAKEFERVGLIEEKRLRQMKHSIIIILISTIVLEYFLLSQNKFVQIIIFIIIIPVFIVVLYRNKKSQIDPLDRYERTHYELCRVLNALQGFLLERSEKNKQTSIRRIKRLSSYFIFWAKNIAPPESVDISVSIGTNFFDNVLPLIKQIHVKKSELLRNKLDDLKLISTALEKLVILSYHRVLNESNLAEFNDQLKTLSQYQEHNRLKLFFSKYQHKIYVILAGVLLTIGYTIIQLFIHSIIKNDLTEIIVSGMPLVVILYLFSKNTSIPRQIPK